MSFSFITIPNPISGSGKFYRIKYNNLNCPILQTWALNSCAAAQITNLDGLYSLQHNPSLFFDYVKTIFENEETYFPKEILMLISHTQMEREYIKKLIALPNMKRVDEWKNRSHPPGSNVYLYRYSYE